MKAEPNRSPIDRCVECGAPIPDSTECWSRVHELLEVEAQLTDLDPESAKRAHFFAIATYQLQHPSRSTAEALGHLRERVAEMTSTQPQSIDSMRREMGRSVANARVSRTADSSDRSHIDPRWPAAWAMNVVDVLEAPRPAYPATVAAWAVATLADLDAAMPAK